MTESIGKLQIVIKGGKPWGFHLQSYSENRSAVMVDHIEPGGKAEIHGGLKVGDHIIKINDVLCLSLADALQLIDSAFRTLTILVWRPSYCAQSDKITHNNNIVLKPQNFSSLPYSPSDKKLNATLFGNFISSAVIPKFSDKYASNSNVCKSENSLSSLPHQLSNFARTPTQSPQQRKGPFHKLCHEESLNKSTNNFSTKCKSNQKYFNPLLSSQSHQSAKLQYIYEQYPLSELFLNHKSNLKLESLAFHSKRLLKTYQSQEIGFKSANPRNYKEIPSIAEETNTSQVSECLCCMYPKCHSSYKSCKMHSPPERDLSVSLTTVVDHPVNNQYMNYEPKQEKIYKSNSVTSCRFPEDLSSKNLNCILYRNTLKIKEDCFKNSDLKIFKPVELSVDPEPPFPDYYDHRRQRQNDIFYQKKISDLKPDHCNDNNGSFNCQFDCNKEQKYNSCVNKTLSYQTFSREVMNEVSTKHTLLVNHSEQNNLTVYGQNNMQRKAMFEVCNPHASSSVLHESSYQSSYFKEKGHSMFCQSNNDYVEYSKEADIVKVCVESSKSDGDEDEELCLIEENAKNNQCVLTPSSLSVTPDLALPSPPHNDDAEIIPTNEPLPSPPSFSPIKEVIYENIEINKVPSEAIYANLEMLKIECSVVNSATQTSTSLQKPFESSYSEPKQLSKSFSFVETEIFSNIIAPTFGNKFRNDHLRSFLPSQVQHSSILKESVPKSEETCSIERHALSLPLTSAYFTTSEPKAKFLTRYINSFHNKDFFDSGLNNKKEELMSSINKKLGILRFEQIALKGEIKQNDELGCSLSKKLGKLAQLNEMEKFRTHIEELEKITNLMLSLSGRLARAENALLILPSDSSSEEKRILEEKYARLSQQYEEAKHLKKCIDKRNCQVSMFLQKYFSAEEFTDYDHFIMMKVKLLMDYRELVEKINLGEEQLDALKSKVNNQCFNKLKDNLP